MLCYRCSFRCNNSLAILQRQAKAAKLATCECDGTEPFDCEGIKNNTARLCFPGQDEVEGPENEEELEEEEERTNEVETSGAACHSFSGPRGVDDFFGRATLGAALVLLLLLMPAR